MVFGCFAGAGERVRSSESDVRGVFNAVWDLKYMVLGCFAGARERGLGCLTVHFGT